MGVQVIPIPTEVVSHSLPFPFPFPILCFIPIPMGFPWDSRSHWESHSHAHLYSGLDGFVGFFITRTSNWFMTLAVPPDFLCITCCTWSAPVASVNVLRSTICCVQQLLGVTSGVDRRLLLPAELERRSEFSHGTAAHVSLKSHVP